MSSSLTSDQLRAARAILRLDQIGLSERSGVSVETIKRIERTDGPLKAQYGTLSSLKETLESLGIEFLYDDSGKDAGVRRYKDRRGRIIDAVKAVAVDAIYSSIDADARNYDFETGDPLNIAKEIFRSSQFIFEKNVGEAIRKVQ